MSALLLLPPDFTLDQVESIYIGKGHCCRCGCGGDYLRVKDGHSKRMAHYMKKLASGEYQIIEQDGLNNEVIYEIELSKAGHDRVATFYVKKK
jgi:hypothetical protein